MRSGDVLNNGETDTGPRDVTCLCAAVEAVEDPRLVLFRNRGPGIVHGDVDGAVPLGADVDRGRRRRILQRVVEQLTKSESEQLAIRISKP